jgi:hypothetical protein
MSTRAHSQTVPERKRSISALPNGLLQRTKGLGEKEHCGQQQTLQKKTDNQISSGISAEPRFGHNFSKIPIHAEVCPRIQTKLAVNMPGDVFELEADRVAEGITAAARNNSINSALPHIRSNAVSATGVEDAMPASADLVLSSPGRPLDWTTQRDMGERFGHDFSHVRVHTDTAAEQSARDVNARAYTVGRNIVFAENQFAPGTENGRRLLAHELTHVLQQSGATAHGCSQGIHLIPKTIAPTVAQCDKKKDHGSSKKPKVPQICGRASRKASGNSITKVNIDVGANTLTIEWSDPKRIPPGSAGTHKISSGTGLCCVDCNDDKISQTSGRLCTPKGGTWKVSSIGCALSGHPTARNPTYFQRGGIAIHSGNTSNPPRSHGCARTSTEISELIHDNVVPGQTDIASSGTWASSKCYKTEAANDPVNRKDVCDGNKLKSKKKKNKRASGSIEGGQMERSAPKKKPPKKTPIPSPTPTKPPAGKDVPVAVMQPDDNDVLAMIDSPAGQEENELNGID